jgi:hypothetical protein
MILVKKQIMGLETRLKNSEEEANLKIEIDNLDK